MVNWSRWLDHSLEHLLEHSSCRRAGFCRRQIVLNAKAFRMKKVAQVFIILTPVYGIHEHKCNAHVCVKYDIWERPLSNSCQVYIERDRDPQEQSRKRVYRRERQKSYINVENHHWIHKFLKYLTRQYTSSSWYS